MAVPDHALLDVPVAVHLPARDVALFRLLPERRRRLELNLIPEVLMREIGHGRHQLLHGGRQQQLLLLLIVEDADARAGDSPLER